MLYAATGIGSSNRIDPGIENIHRYSSSIVMYLAHVQTMYHETMRLAGVTHNVPEIWFCTHGSAVSGHTF
jgi:hypothetical protein